MHGSQRTGIAIFLHIPKTAGSSLERILGRQYRGAIYTLDEWRPDKEGSGLSVEKSIAQFHALPLEEKGRIKILKGHFHFGLAPMLPLNANYFTLLRDPVERVVSTYYFVLRNSSNYLHKTVSSANMSLKDFIEGDLTPEIRNDQTRRIAGVTGVSPINGDFGSGQEMLAAAKRNIEKYFVVVGLTERFDETVLLLKQIFGWVTPFYNSVNVGTNRPEAITDEITAIIRDKNALDMELYRFAQERFEKQVAGLGPSFQRELWRFRRLNPWFATYFRWRRRFQESFLNHLRRQ